MSYFVISELDSAIGVSVPITGKIYKLGDAYNFILGDKYGGHRRIMKYAGDGCVGTPVWSTKCGLLDGSKLTENEKDDLTEQMIELAKFLLDRLNSGVPPDKVYVDAVYGKIPGMENSWEYTLEHDLNEFIALNTYKMYYHAPLARKLKFLGMTTNRDPRHMSIPIEQYMAVFKKGPRVYRYFVTRGAGPLEVVSLSDDGSPHNKLLSNLVNVVMGNHEYPSFSDEE